MSGFFISTKLNSEIDKVNHYLKYRGMDRIIQEEIDPFHLLYHICLLNKDDEVWYRVDDYIVVFDGTMYSSSNQEHTTIAKYILEMYKEHDYNLAKYMDGEYAFCVVDQKKKCVIFSMDIFGTKPLWFSITGGCSVASYKSALEGNQDVDIIKAEPNTTYVFDYSKHILSQYEIYHFDLTQYKDTYEDWSSAFTKAVVKRIDRNGVGVGLSSGYDSGAIYCELTQHDQRFRSFSYPSRESKDILEQRVTRSKNAEYLGYDESEFLLTMKQLYRNCEPFHEEYFDLLKDEASIGLAIMCKRLKKEGIGVYLTGYGADEIISDYGFAGHKINALSQFGGVFPESLEMIFPWTNFFSGCQKVYLAREEYVCGLYGVQARFPFLDKDVVQEFLWLTSDLKNKNYKAPIQYFFEQNEFPYRNEKIGFYMR